MGCLNQTQLPATQFWKTSYCFATDWNVECKEAEAIYTFMSDLIKTNIGFVGYL